MDENWPLLLSFFPDGWRNMVADSDALKALAERQVSIHLESGHMLRETVVRAKKTGLSDLSDIALLKRL